jgi:hypothetical protein
MNLMRLFDPLLDYGARALSIAILTLLPAHLATATAAAGVKIAGGALYYKPAWPGFRHGDPVMYPLYLYPGSCLAFGGCTGVQWEDGLLPRRPVAPDPPGQAALEAAAASRNPWGHADRLPPPTAQNQIQPEYLNASTLRQELACSADNPLGSGCLLAEP